MKKFGKIILSVIAVLLIAVLVAGCGGGKKKSDNGGGGGGGGQQPGDYSQSVSLTLAPATIFNADFTTATLDNWEFANGATGSIEGGVLKVTAPTAEGIALKLKESVWENIKQQLGTDGFYVEMLIKPTAVPATGNNKNFGLASHISSDNTTWYYAGFNGNNRMQAGHSGNLKGHQNTGDGLSFSKEEDLVYYKWRYEYENDTINFYCNDVYMGKNGVLADYKPGMGYSGTIGVYSCFVPFELASVRVGKVSENRFKLRIETDDKTFPKFYSTYLRLINTVSSTGIQIDDERTFTINFVDAKVGEDGWTAFSTNPAILKVSASSGNNGDSFTVTGVGVGTASVIVTSSYDPGSKRSITYQVKEKSNFVDDAYTNITDKVYPNIGSTTAYTDGELAITFDSEPVLSDINNGQIFIYKYSDDSLVDTIKLSNASETAFSAERGMNLDIGNQMVRVEDKTLYITPHFGKLEYGTKYYVAIPNEVITGSLGGKTFTGFSPKNKTWHFTTRTAPSITGSVITVNGSQKSEANFRTVQKALKYVADNNIDNAVIEIDPGIYRELLTFKKDLNVTLKGKGSQPFGQDVIIQYTNGNSPNGSTSGRTLTYFSSNGTVNLVNLTLKNTAQKSVNSQAETIYFDNDNGKLVAKNCSFISQQDTILTKGYNWFYQCYIEGNTDFIWGYAKVALFEDCDIKVLDNSGNASYIFQARCTNLTDKGYVLFNCDITNENASAKGSYFARSGGETKFFDNVSIINCKLLGNPIMDKWYNKELDSSTPNPNPATANASSGWKQYGLVDGSGNAVTITCANAYTLTDEEYNAGWSSREKILGSWSPVLP